MPRKLTFLLLMCLCLLSACRGLSPEPAVEKTSLPTALPTPTTQASASAEPDPLMAEFESSTLEAIIEEFKAEVMQVRIGNKSLYPYPSYQVRVHYEGECREIPQNRIDLIAMWLTHFNPQNLEDALSLYEKECLFSENGAQYWMPIQKIVLTALERDVPAGDEVDLYIRWIGINREKIEIDWVFWIVDFLEV